MRKICFVCTGGTCRTPMAEKLMKKQLELNAIDDVVVQCAGIDVVPGDVVNPKAVVALKKYGIRKFSKKAKQLCPKDLKKDILFITMTEEQKKCFSGHKNVFTLGELVGGGDVIDPYGLDQEAYDKTAQMLWDYTNKLVQNLKQ